MNMTKRDVGSKTNRPLVCMRRPGLAGVGLVGLGLALSAAACRDRGSPQAAPPPTPMDAAPRPRDPDVANALPTLPGLGPYANLHAAFVARCPITLPEPTNEPWAERRLKEFVVTDEAGRRCRTKRDTYLAYFWIQYTASDPYYSSPRGHKDGYERQTGNVDEIKISYTRIPNQPGALPCQSIPDELAELYRMASGLSDTDTVRLAATLRSADRLVPPGGYGRIWVDGRTIFASIDLGGEQAPDDECRGMVQTSRSLGNDPLVIDVALAATTNNDSSN